MLANSAKADAITTDSLARLIVQGNVRIEKVLAKQVKDTGVNDRPAAKAVNNTVAPVKQSLLVSNLISFLPVIFFLMIVMIVGVKLKKDGVLFSDFLIDKDVQMTIKKEEVKAAVANATANVAMANAVAANAASFQAAGVAPNIQAPNPQNAVAAKALAADDQQQSVSRLIAFISGITSVALAVCITTFYMYRWFLGDTNVEIDNLSGILYGLGLGVVPYGFNKIASALR